ncbi:MAG: tetratricopeptide repeat protein [Vicinamibacterales bacterium]
MALDAGSALSRTEALIRAGRPELAILEFKRLVREQPHDVAAAAILAEQFVTAAKTAAAEGRCAEALAYLSVAADWRESRGDGTGAAKLRTLGERLELADLETQLGLGHEEGERRSTPAHDIRLQASQARAYVARGDAVGAAKHLMPEMADGDPLLLLAIAEIQLRGGRLDQGIAAVEHALAQGPSVGDDVVRIGVELAERQPDAGFLLVDMVADVWAAQSQWSKATAAFERFFTRRPDYAPALVRLREMEAAAGAPDDKRVIPFRPLPSVAAKSRNA